MTWAEAVAFALTLPGTAMEKFYDAVVPKVRGKAFISRSHEPGSFTICCDSAEKVALLQEIDPDTFWQSPHYQGTRWILAREGHGDDEMLRGLIESAWAARASKAQRAERDAASS
ncbi:MmcQ/YjbR family DNA-binding protein [Sphingobium aquiterrae]|uniref:MmcQ/YjbR family DNA-binding protein n=1 Tax=Sphingobium aquiterrae TaxID=2038656 RepID=UPI003018D1A7